MGKRPDFDEVITSLYEAATDASLWRPALASIAALFGPTFAGYLFTWDRARNIGFAEVDREELIAANEDYIRYYNTIDPRAAMIASRPVGGAYACHHYFDDAYVAKSEFYQDFLIRIGGRYIAGMKLTDSDQHTALLSIHRSATQGPFEPADLKLLERLQPHFSQAANLFHKFVALHEVNDRGAAILDRFPLGVLVVSRDARILDMNAAAEVLIKRGDSLRVRNNQIVTADARRMNSLHRMIIDAHASAGGQIAQPGGVIRLEKSSGQGYLTIVVAPLRQATRGITDTTSIGVVLFIRDSEAQPIFPSVWLSQLYGLTPAEAAVALAISSGKTLEEIADSTGVTRNTIRVQTQSVLNKTGARRQAELVRLLAQLPLIR